MGKIEENKKRLEEILQSAQSEDTTTEELLQLLDESIKIGNEICDESQAAIQATLNKGAGDFANEQAAAGVAANTANTADTESKNLDV